MRFAPLAILMAALGAPGAADAQGIPASLGPDAGETVVAFTGGHVWNGEEFVDRPLVVRDGRFVDPSVRPDSTVDLAGGYVVPPFGDAHPHMFADTLTAQWSDLYLENGIFYVLNLTGPAENARRVRRTYDFTEAGTLDVAYVHGGISTSTGDRPHPASFFERYRDLFGAPEDAEGEWTLEGDAYWFMESVDEVRERWSEYIAQDPHVVKVYVMESGGEGCGYGLCPDALRAVVDRAHDVGKRVFAHVNTAADVRLALDAGVDGLAHLPGGNDGVSVDEPKYWLDSETIRRAGRAGIVLTPTASLLVEDVAPFRRSEIREEIARQRRQLRRLHEAGVRIALGADEWETSALHEALYLHEQDVFDNRTLLEIWSETTPKAIFPDRPIAELTPGHEASFLVLARNPLEDFDAVREIRLRVKEGRLVGGPDGR